MWRSQRDQEFNSQHRRLTGAHSIRRRQGRDKKKASLAKASDDSGAEEAELTELQKKAMLIAEAMGSVSARDMNARRSNVRQAGHVSGLQALLARGRVASLTPRPPPARGGTMLIRSGLLFQRPTLKSKAVADVNSHRDAPPYWSPSEKHLKAADEFDERHRIRADRAEKALKALQEDISSAGRDRVCRSTTHSVRSNRYFIDEGVTGITRYATGRKKELVVAERQWSVYESIWAPRCKYADSRDVHETEAALKRAYGIDWSYVKITHGMEAQIRKVDTSDDAVARCHEAFADNLALMYSTFDYYAALGTGDPLALKLNAFKLFVEECDLVEEGTTSCALATLLQSVYASKHAPHTIRVIASLKWLAVGTVLA